jgi:hypothetical protein
VPTFSIPVCAQATSRWLFTREWRIGGEVDVRLAAAEHCFVMNVTKKIGHRVRQCCRAPATPPLPRPLRVLACRERYRLVGVDPCPVTTTVLRCPLAVSVARRFLTSSSAWRWVENKPKRSSPMRTDQPSLVGSTRKIVVIACLATIERTSGKLREPHPGCQRLPEELHDLRGEWSCLPRKLGDNGTMLGRH